VNRAFFDRLSSELRGEVRADVPLADCTTWRVGGPADLLLVPADRADLRRALRLLAAENVPWLVLGAGSNLLVRDGGVRGAVLRLIRLRSLAFARGGRVEAEAGVMLGQLIRESAQRGLAGLEGLAGIPGTLGGAVAMNAGAGGQQLADVISTVTLAGADGEETRPGASLDFGYRRCSLPAGRIVVAAELDLHPGDPAELAVAIAGRIAHRRRAHGVGGPNAGSVFKNPPGEAAWRLIEAAGLRGSRIGGAQFSDRHSNFIVNRGGATAADILALIELAREEVRRRTGIELETEVRIVGED
jgi:UDP-N-acetylmuramate dehydrogenase